ncbi:short-subunit dehydrogenase [Dyadobacter jejuensis]|uniref:Short-subunit dehydrogenase n=1 Tax=Dyadobacter jejuensis TaxID=1082580 RepID=A0A316AIA4_9BACT|nr:SDR family oxidoreductase [Dyadobacter jejuensis]PWJ57008.1 short-subunit dehydrogenase [Dyadobacter jejuensis]
MGISINNRVALVTGANRGIGKAIVASLIAHGAQKVYLVVRNPTSTQELEEQYGTKVQTIQADVADSASIKALAQQATDVSIVINNAGIGTPHSTLGDDVEADFQKQLDVNAFGLLRIANAFAHILEKNKGALVQLNSIASIKNFAQLSTYSASKAAAYSLTQGLRVELGAKGVTVVSVHPGPIATDMGVAAGFKDGASPSVVAEGIITSLQDGDFHLFPDPLAKQIEGAYQSFSDHDVMADLS